MIISDILRGGGHGSNLPGLLLQIPQRALEGGAGALARHAHCKSSSLITQGMRLLGKCKQEFRDLRWASCTLRTQRLLTKLNAKREVRKLNAIVLESKDL